MYTVYRRGFHITTRRPLLLAAPVPRAISRRRRAIYVNRYMYFRYARIIYCPECIYTQRAQFIHTQSRDIVRAGSLLFPWAFFLISFFGRDLMERTAAHPPHDDAYRFSCLFYSDLYTPGRNRREIYSCWHWWDAPPPIRSKHNNV